MAATYVCPTCLTPVSIEGRARGGVLQHECPKHGWVAPIAAFRCAPEDVDASGGYALDDPKHPDFHSVHADIWDAREGK